MEIKVKLFATLRENRGKEVSLELEEGATAEDALKKLEIPKKDVAILMINGRDDDPGKELKDGDLLSIFPPVGGG